MHASILQKDGHPLVGDGADILCDIARSHNGYFVDRVSQVIDCGNTPFVEKNSAQKISSLVLTMSGIVKWYDCEKEFGFILPEDGIKDIFVHKSCLLASGLEELLPGQLVSVTYKTVAKGREALTVEVKAHP